MAKKTISDSTLGIRLEHDVKEALERAAADDGRTTSSKAKKILSDWLKEKGFLRVSRT